MNNFGNYIHGLKKANKALFKAKKIQITPLSFEKQLELAYNQGVKDANGDYDKKSLWEKIFGMSMFDSTTNYIYSKIELEEEFDDIKRKK